MAIVLGWPEDTTEPSVNLAAELSVQRELTEWFIAMDPSIITLTPRTKVRTASGAWEAADGPARTSQTFKMIAAGANDGIVETVTGIQRKFDYIIVGRWDAVVEIGDWWQEGSQTYEVMGIMPYHGYEVKAGIVSHGGDPQHG